MDFIKRDDKEYPQLLEEIPDPPERLYFIGDISILKTVCIGIVGTRRPTEYGRWAAMAAGRKLGENGVSVVSGMAMGIDSYAHKGCLAAGGKTVAVLGCGVDICYPASNSRLKREIEENGVVISEYPPGTEPKPFTFPQRNRIISGLSRGVVVVEAGLKSGSLITAELAAAQGRQVFAVPGNIDSVLSIGANKLIRDGAVPVSVLDDVLWDSGIGEVKSGGPGLEKLGDDEKAVFAAVSGGGEVSADHISELLSMPAGKVNGILTVLEMKGLIISSMGKFFPAGTFL